MCVLSFNPPARQFLLYDKTFCSWPKQTISPLPQHHYTSNHSVGLPSVLVRQCGEVRRKRNTFWNLFPILFSLDKQRDGDTGVTPLPSLPPASSITP
mmetsp:Transcript_23961/g.29422  ORF Transcript_23961/g.29422 Transcript_23961/m.29422 type:complete len:97 (+) Transcript_23961:189-479(+)